MDIIVGISLIFSILVLTYSIKVHKVNRTFIILSAGAIVFTLIALFKVVFFVFFSTDDVQGFDPVCLFVSAFICLLSTRLTLSNLERSKK